MKSDIYPAVLEDFTAPANFKLRSVIGLKNGCPLWFSEAVAECPFPQTAIGQLPENPCMGRQSQPTGCFETHLQKSFTAVYMLLAVHCQYHSLLIQRKISLLPRCPVIL